jgi:hypothetical protein
MGFGQPAFPSFTGSRLRGNANKMKSRSLALLGGGAFFLVSCVICYSILEHGIRDQAIMIGILALPATFLVMTFPFPLSYTASLALTVIVGTIQYAVLAVIIGKIFRRLKNRH